MDLMLEYQHKEKYKATERRARLLIGNGYGADWFLSTEPMSMADVKKIYDSGVPVNVPHATHELSVAGD